MQLSIPNIGERLTLAADWTFRLFNESRCQFFADCPSPAYPVPDPTWSISQVKDCTLPAGTVLAVDRIYIRQNLDAFASVSFRIVSTAAPWVAKQRRRFWAKLSDVNCIQIVPRPSDPLGAITINPADIVARAQAYPARADNLLPTSADQRGRLAHTARGLALELEVVTATLRVQAFHAVAEVAAGLHAQCDAYAQLAQRLVAQADRLERAA